MCRMQTGEMTQEPVSLMSMQENVGSDPQHPGKKPGMEAFTYNLQEADTQLPEVGFISQ